MIIFSTRFVDLSQFDLDNEGVSSQEEIDNWFACMAGEKEWLK